MKKYIVILAYFVTLSCSDPVVTEQKPLASDIEQLLPLAVGNEWHYRRVDGVIEKKLVAAILDMPLSWQDTLGNKRELGNFQFFGVENADGEIPFKTWHTNTPQGVAVGSFYSPGINLHCFYPSYPKGGIDTTRPFNAFGPPKWTKITTMTVPAGTFHNVWKMERFDDTLYFKRGVGIIQVGNSSSSYRFGELVSYSIK